MHLNYKTSFEAFNTKNFLKTIVKKKSIYDSINSAWVLYEYVFVIKVNLLV